MDSTSIKLPGFGLPVNDQGPQDRFQHPLTGWEGTPITIRERAMMALMDMITDKPGWQRKVFDENITQKWRQEVLDTEEADITEKIFDWIIAELRDKAPLQEKYGLVSVLDIDASVIKSDTAISQDLAENLKVACEPLESVPAKLKEWHPGSDDIVHDLVHPSLFPLIYGRSKIVSTGRVGLQDCIDFIGKGETVRKPDDSQIDFAPDDRFLYSRNKPRFWSKDFQWLPCQVDFSGDEEVSITSYINNLHPKEHLNLYSAIEQCIAKVIPLWDCALTSLQKQPENPRIIMERTEYSYPQGRDVPKDYNPPDLNLEQDQWASNYDRRNAWERTTRVLIRPEPGEYKPLKETGAEEVSLRSQYKETGLQVIVKLANIELTPDKPNYEGGTWHVEGQLNERICASALYYYDTENITESFLAFRQRVGDEEFEMKAYEQDDYEGVEHLYGVKQDGARVQQLGRITTKEGRLIAFPNVLQHKVSPFGLQDPSKPGHRKILALFLVDPHTPIISTANVPPQQKHWWTEKIRKDQSLSMLPTEIEEQVMDEVGEIPITLKEAKEIRLRLMEERKAFVEDVEKEMEAYTFSFCEH